MEAGRKLFTVAIPTYNRAEYLRQNLTQLRSELTPELQSQVEILVSDNCSPDHTQEVVQSFLKDGMQIKYIRNAENIGWGGNFFQCFDQASAKYVLLLGDDDVLWDGALAKLVNTLQRKEVGVVTFKSYGYNEDWKGEYPGSFGKEKLISESTQYLREIGPVMTMISCCAVNMDVVDFDQIKQLPPGNFAHVHLIVTAALNAKDNLLIDQFLVAAKRNNSSDYHFSKVFVEEIWNLYEMYADKGFHQPAIQKMKQQWLFSYYPYYWLMQRLEKNENYKDSLRDCNVTFKGLFWYTFWNKPILTLPKPLALLWGGFTTFVGRSMNGELLRGIYFAWNKIFKNK